MQVVTSLHGPLVACWNPDQYKVVDRDIGLLEWDFYGLDLFGLVVPVGLDFPEAVRELCFQCFQFVSILFQTVLGCPETLFGVALDPPL